MKEYKEIRQGEALIPHSTIKGLRLAIRRGKQKSGSFIGICPNGNKHYWTIEAQEYKTKGHATKAKGKIGGGMTMINPIAKLVSIIKA